MCPGLEKVSLEASRTLGWGLAWCASRGADWNEVGALIGQDRAQAAGLGGIPAGRGIRAGISLVSQVRMGFLGGRLGCRVGVNKPIRDCAWRHELGGRSLWQS